MNADAEPLVSRRVLWLSGAMALFLLLAMGAFLALRGRAAPLWVTRHAVLQSVTP